MHKHSGHAWVIQYTTSNLLVTRLVHHSAEAQNIHLYDREKENYLQ